MDQRTLLNPGPVLTNVAQVADVVICTFDPIIDYGDTLDRDAWILTRAGVPLGTGPIAIIPPNIVVTFFSFIGPPDLIEFVGPPPIFRDVTNGILRSFVAVVP